MRLKTVHNTRITMHETVTGDGISGKVETEMKRADVFWSNNVSKLDSFIDFMTSVKYNYQTIFSPSNSYVRTVCLSLRNVCGDC
jgi:hypothetical protein